MEVKLLRSPFLSVLRHSNDSWVLRQGSIFPRQTLVKDRGLRLPSSRLTIRVAFQASAAAVGMTPKNRIDETQSHTLDGIRNSLTQQEDSIIYSLLGRAPFCYNAVTYDSDSLAIDGFNGSLVEFMVKETEKLHAKVGRYKCLEEHPFFPHDLPEPILPPLEYPKVLSKRVHYGKFVAEAKFRASPDVYESAIKTQDRTRLMDLLTYPSVEEAIKKRVEVKTRTYGQEMNANEYEEIAEPVYKINPALVGDLYGDWIMPLIKEVQVEYQLRRLD